MIDELPPTKGKWFPKRDRDGKITGWLEMLVGPSGGIYSGRYVKATAELIRQSHERKDVIHGARH